jgi:hypothetical protein
MEMTNRSRTAVLRRQLRIVTVVLAALCASPVAAFAGAEAYLTDFSTLLIADTYNPSVVTRLPMSGTIAVAPVVGSGGTTIYVPLQSGVAVVDALSRTVAKTISTPGQTSLALLNPAGARLFVAGSEAVTGGTRGVVNVIDTATRTLVSTVRLGQSIGSMAIHPGGQRVYVAYEDPGGFESLAVLDASAGALVASISLPPGLPRAMVFHVGLGQLFVSGRDGIAVVDTTAQVVRKVIPLRVVAPATSRVTRVLRVDPSGSTVYAFGTDIGAQGTLSGFMAALDASLGTVSGEVALPMSPAAAALHPDGTRIYAAGEQLGGCLGCRAIAGGIAVINRLNRSVMSLVQTGRGPLLAGEVPAPGTFFPPMVEVHPDGATVYATEPGGRASVIDVATSALKAQFPGNGIAFGALSGQGAQPQLYVLPSQSGASFGRPVGVPGDHLVSGDYDGDRRADQAVWRPREAGQEGIWIISRSSGGADVRQAWGSPSQGDIPVPADYDGDGKHDLAVWRPFTGEWWIRGSSNGATSNQVLGGAAAGDIPVPADYDGDGRADLAVWRPGSGQAGATFLIVRSRDGSQVSVPLGTVTDVPVPGDYDGDGRVDPAVWRPSTGQWTFVSSRTGAQQTVTFGNLGDVPLPADFDGNGTADQAVWRPRTGEWLRMNGASLAWGAAGDRPVARDFDGDGKVDRALVRTSGVPMPVISPSAPPAPQATLTLLAVGTGQGTTSGGGTYAAGTSIPVTATPAAGSAFSGWSGSAGCPSGLQTSSAVSMPSSSLTCTATFTLIVTPPPGQGGWVRLSAAAGDRTPSWFNLASDAQGRLYSLNWDGELWRFDGATNVWGRLGKFFNDQRHNCTLTGDPLNNRIWFSGQCAPASEGAFWVYDIATNTVKQHCANPCGSAGANSIGAYDPINKRLVAWAGWLTDLSYYANVQVLPLQPIGASWQTVPTSPTPVPFGECDRLAHNRGGWDGRRNRAWVVMADGALWTFQGGVWTKRPTVGGPPNVCTVYAYHEGIDRIVGWTGVDVVTSETTPLIRQTWLLDPQTLVWSAGPSGLAGSVVPPGVGPAAMAIGYDGVRRQVVLRLGQETWAFRGDGSSTPLPPPPPPPQTFAVTVGKTGTGTGTVTGAGSYVAGAIVTLTAAPGTGSSFSGWSPSPCAGSFAMPASPVACTATFTATVPPPSLPPPLPPGPPGPLQQQVFTRRPVPQNKDLSPFVLGSKDVQRTYDTRRHQIIVGTGDYSANLWPNSGHNTIFAYDANANVWSPVATFCAPPGQISPARPTDRGLFVYDSTRDAIWLWSMVDNAVAGQTCTGPPAGSGSTFTKGLLKFDMATKVWTKHLDGSPGTMSMGAYDAGSDSIIFIRDNNNKCALGGTAIVTFSLQTFTVTSEVALCHTPTPVWGAGGGWLGASAQWQSAFAWDAQARVAYVCGQHPRVDGAGNLIERQSVCHRYDHNTRTLTKIADVPMRPGVQAPSYYTHLAWDSVNHRVLWPVIDGPCAQVRQMLAYDPATNRWQDLPIIGDGTSDIRGSLSVFDPAANALFLASTGFCDLPLPNQTDPFLWRYSQ